MHFKYLFFLLLLYIFETDCRTPLTKWELGDPPVDLITWMCVKRLRAAKSWNRIMSEGYPRRVDTKNTRCSWKIQAPAKKRIRLSFKSMSLRSSDPDGCPDNYVLVIDENIGRYQQRLCGRGLPDDIVSSRNTLRIDFQIDVANIADSKGFLINYKYTSEKAGFYGRNPPPEASEAPVSVVTFAKEPKRLNRYNKPQDDGDGVNYITIIICALIVIVAILVICWVLRRKKKEKRKQKIAEKEEQEIVKDSIPPPNQANRELPLAATPPQTLPPPYEQIQEPLREPEPIEEPIYTNLQPNSEPPLPRPPPEKAPIEPPPLPAPNQQQQQQQQKAAARNRRSHRRSNTAPSRRKSRRPSFYYDEQQIREYGENITSDRMLYPTSRPPNSRLVSQNPKYDHRRGMRTYSTRQKSRSTGRNYPYHRKPSSHYETNDDPRKHRQHRLPSQMPSIMSSQIPDQRGDRLRRPRDKLEGSRSQVVQWNT